MGKRDSAGILLVSHNTCRFMVVKRAMDQADSPGVWAVPAGAIEPNEEPLEAALRELTEETEYEWGNVTNIRKMYHSVAENGNFTLFAGIVPKEFNPVLDFEHTAFEWVNHNSFDAYAAYEFHPDLYKHFDKIKNYIEETCDGKGRNLLKLARKRKEEGRQGD